MTTNDKPATETTREQKAKIKQKVAGLLAKAESTEFPAEAQELAAKAAELMARYNLDAAAARDDKGARPEPISTVDFTVSGQGWHGKARSALYWAVAEATGCKAVHINNKMNGEDRLVTVVGAASTIESLKMLLPSILLQAENSGAKATKKHMTEIGPRIDTAANKNIERRTYFRSYLEGYGKGVAQKISDTRQDIVEEMKEDPKAMILVRDEDRVKAEFARKFPQTKLLPADKKNAAGNAAGVRDGRLADTGQTKVKTKGAKVIG
ncbi:hypothetical protein JOD54_001419 [Actinokineospora baliensis]|uniref:DUF2786 domain-containing protein n=1 Tax=Actinokineospora baliensis TaxID=547056 RepID=UPI001956F625|nr:DUF2786 domain-containing protein [Actinokineospora baliensis]MBM7771215.1 hypothetical protein [Actinokineospora baliensis]